MFHAGEHDLIALEAGALDRSHERAAHIIRLEVSYWHLSDMLKRSENVCHRAKRSGAVERDYSDWMRPW
jgi:hypothetical protein